MPVKSNFPVNTMIFYPSKITVKVFNSLPFMKNWSSHSCLAEQTAQITGCLSEHFVLKVKQSLFTSVFTLLCSLPQCRMHSAGSCSLSNRTVLVTVITNHSGDLCHLNNEQLSCSLEASPALQWAIQELQPHSVRTLDITTAARNKAVSTASPHSTVLDAILDFHV